MPVKKGDKIKVEYTGTFDDGEVFDSTDNHSGEPLEFEVGAGQMIPGFDNAVVGMEKDEEKQIKLEPKDAYGEPDERLIQKVPKDKMPEGMEVKEGMMLGVAMPTGQQVPAKVVGIDDSEVSLDLNHPLAGKTLNFKIKVVGISE